MTPATSTGIHTFTLATTDAIPNISLTLTASSTSGDDEITVAQSIVSQFNTQLAFASALYTGTPVFSDQAPAATFYVASTDHCVSIWSQARYRLQLTSNTAGTSVVIGPCPIPITLARALALGPLTGVDFTDSNENLLSNSQIINLLEYSSDQVMRLINNYFVIACHLHEHLGNMEDTIFLRAGPIVDWDRPNIRRPIAILSIAIPILQSSIAFSVDRRSKMVNYRYGNSLMYTWDPYDMNNEVKMTYRAGHLNFPRILQEKIVQAASLTLNDTNIKSLKGGSFAVEFRLPIETLRAITQELRQYEQNTT